MWGGATVHCDECNNRGAGQMCDNVKAWGRLSGKGKKDFMKEVLF